MQKCRHSTTFIVQTPKVQCSLLGCCIGSVLRSLSRRPDFDRIDKPVNQHSHSNGAAMHWLSGFCWWIQCRTLPLKTFISISTVTATGQDQSVEITYWLSFEMLSRLNGTVTQFYIGTRHCFVFKMVRKYQMIYQI